MKTQTPTMACHSQVHAVGLAEHQNCMAPYCPSEVAAAASIRSTSA